MNIVRFAWRDFRNLRAGELFPDPEANVIYGDNAQGKTNLLEGMWLFTGERSFRRAKDAELVRRGCESAALSLGFFADGRDQAAKITIEGGHRSAELNGVKKRSCSAMIGEFRAAVFSPEHLALLSGGPAGRRNFVDAALCQMKPSFAAVVLEYSRALAQRNALLKDIPRCADLLDTLDVWDARLARAGEKLAAQRAEYLARLSPRAAEFYGGMCGGRETLSLRYECGAQNLAEALRESRRNDILSGHTGVGPHRDDISVEISSFDARSYGSQGQKRSAVIAMKLAEAELLETVSGEAPAVFLDDVLSELDGTRRDYLLNRLGRFQVFITCCEPDLSGICARGRVFHVKNGEPAAEQCGAAQNTTEGK